MTQGNETERPRPTALRSGTVWRLWMRQRPGYPDRGWRGTWRCANPASASNVL